MAEVKTPTGPRRILSGVQPSGKLHIGNYFGAVRQHIELQEQGDAYYFIADYHALTTLQDAAKLRENVHDVALDYLALGLDPAKAVFFRQSDVPEVCELTWFLSVVAPMGLLQKAVSYKEKVEKGIDASVGLFSYPVLMAADILAYRSNLVPVGRDQVQHLEITRDIAEKFNRVFDREVFPIPEYRLSREAKVPGTDGQKMSKSYGNTIEIFAEGKPLRKVVMAVVTDSLQVADAKDPDKCNVYALWNLFADDAAREVMRGRYQAGGLGYGDVKKELLASIESYFDAARTRRRELVARPDLVEDVLREGAAKARAEAVKTLEMVREAAGMRGRPLV